MKIIEILEKNPKITDEIREFFKQMLLDSFKEKDLPDSFKAKIRDKGVSLKMLEIYLNATPRLICDFMDSKSIIVLPVFSQEQFSFTINGNPYIFTSDRRKEAEIESVIESIIFYTEERNLSDE